VGASPPNGGVAHATLTQRANMMKVHPHRFRHDATRRLVELDLPMPGLVSARGRFGPVAGLTNAPHADARSPQPREFALAVTPRIDSEG
jgi:hypothetical protein